MCILYVYVNDTRFVTKMHVYVKHKILIHGFWSSVLGECSVLTGYSLNVLGSSSFEKLIRQNTKHRYLDLACACCTFARLFATGIELR